MKLRGKKAPVRRDDRIASYDAMRESAAKRGRTKPGSLNPHKGAGKTKGRRR